MVLSIMFKSFSFSSIKLVLIHLVVLTVCASCQDEDGESKNGIISSEVSDWKSPCDLSSLCTKKELISSLNGPLSFRKTLKTKIDKDLNRYINAYGNEMGFVCAQLISVGGCQGYNVENLEEVEFSRYMQGLASCHHRLCHDYFQENRSSLLTKVEKSGSKASFKSYYLMAVKLPLPWYEKSDFLKKYLELIDEDILKYSELGPLISAIPNHQGLKTFIAKRFFKIDGHLEGVAVYLARYQNGWHDIYYKKFLDSKNSVAINAFINSMPVGCPRTTTVLSFKEFLNEDKKKVLQETLNQKSLDKYFSSLKLKSNENSKCLSSLQPAF